MAPTSLPHVHRLAGPLDPAAHCELAGEELAAPDAHRAVCRSCALELLLQEAFDQYAPLPGDGAVLERVVDRALDRASEPTTRRARIPSA